jgi:hypothetical protein
MTPVTQLVAALDELIACVDDRQVAEARERIARSPASGVALAEYDGSGADRWRRPKASVSVCHLTPRTEVTDPKPLVGWLQTGGHEELVTVCVQIVDARAVAHAMRARSEAAVRSIGNQPDDHPRIAELIDEAIRQLVGAISVADVPVADVWEQLVKRGCVAVTVDDVTELVLATSGKAVPGMRRTMWPPSPIRVRFDQESGNG